MITETKKTNKQTSDFLLIILLSFIVSKTCGYTTLKSVQNPEVFPNIWMCYSRRLDMHILWEQLLFCVFSFNYSYVTLQTPHTQTRPLKNITHRYFVGSLYVEDQVLDEGYLVQVGNDTKTCGIR